MAEEQDQSQKTEQPTPKRLADARKKGDAPRSAEIPATAMIAAGGLALWLMSDGLAQAFTRLGMTFLERPHEFLADAEGLQAIYGKLAAASGAMLAGLALLFVIAAAGAHIAQAAPVLAPDRLKPSLKRLSPIEGAKRLFGPQALANFLKGVGKLCIIGAILIFTLWPDHEKLAGLPFADERAALAMSKGLVLKLIAVTVGAMSIVAALDYAFARQQWMKRLMMTREEVKRELKETDGDPQIKGRRRQQREARARRRMMKAVKEASVLIMNPTHYAVALKYESGKTTAPLCVAKGLDDIALRLRAAAEEARVPVVENPPLARALYAAVEIDEEIPVDHYEAVAKVIGYVMGKARAARAR
ncbi:MAG: flagellar biosynthesis protein FlhB [Parvularculaceae bacterium]|nr:flagellar biosynthesis protein FlhB [Parvularculaceae bacterium]